MSFLGKNLSWIVILIILLIVLVIYFLIPWKKIKKNQSTESKPFDEPKSLTKKTKSNLMHGIYNGFGGGQSLRDRRLIVVIPKKDSCDLCLPFENTVISLEDYDKKYITMSEAVSKGYHHLGCTHIDEDFFSGKTLIKKPDFSKEEQEQNFQIKLEKFKLENAIRNLKFQILNLSDNDSGLEKLTEMIFELKKFCIKNELIFDEEKLDPYVNYLVKFS